jgi:hypothetical protein
MRKEHVVWLLVGVGVYYLYLKFRIGVGGNPLAPTFPRG